MKEQLANRVPNPDVELRGQGPKHVHNWGEGHQEEAEMRQARKEQRETARAKRDAWRRSKKEDSKGLVKEREVAKRFKNSQRAQRSHPQESEKAQISRQVSLLQRGVRGPMRVP